MLRKRIAPSGKARNRGKAPPNTPQIIKAIWQLLLCCVFDILKHLHSVRRLSSPIIHDTGARKPFRFVAMAPQCSCRNQKPNSRCTSCVSPMAAGSEGGGSPLDSWQLAFSLWRLQLEFALLV